MAKETSVAKNQHEDHGGVVPWSDLNHDVLSVIMMKLGVIDFVSFSGVCKSWRSLALCNKKKFMTSRPPMLMRISSGGCKELYCYLEDFEGRRFKSLLSNSKGWKTYSGLTCGYLVFFKNRAHEFYFVNPITWHQLYFPSFPKVYVAHMKAILVISPSTHGPMLVVLDRSNHKIWFSSKGAWNYVLPDSRIHDLVAFKGMIYTIHNGLHLGELTLGSKPKWTLLKTKKFPNPCSYYLKFVNSAENLYLVDFTKEPNIIFELDFGEMKWVFLDKKIIGERAFFLSILKHGESWAADPLSRYKTYDYRLYFPHLCLDVDILHE